MLCGILNILWSGRVLEPREESRDAAPRAYNITAISKLAYNSLLCMQPAFSKHFSVHTKKHIGLILV